MGLFQAAYRSYEANVKLAGVEKEGKKTLLPFAHSLKKADIEIKIDSEGNFISAYRLGKNEADTIIPVTEKSAGRTSGYVPHPLCEDLEPMSPTCPEKHEKYLAQLRDWAGSGYSHPTVRAVLAYIEGGGILGDLSEAGVITLSPSGGSENKKDFVRWRVLREGDQEEACWKDQSLFQAYENYYRSTMDGAFKDYCAITGEKDVPTENHPKGISPGDNGAKLISANDKSGFTYRGRFVEGIQAVSVSYTASQKAHSALKWLVGNYGVNMGGRTFLYWNPEGRLYSRPKFKDFDFGFPEKATEPVVTDYSAELRNTLSGYKNMLKPTDGIVAAAFEAATTGRLSLTYYSELNGHDFLDRLYNWYDSCRWNSYSFGEFSPSIARIIKCAYGTERGEFLEVDERVFRQQAQRLFSCVVDCAELPSDIVRALFQRASQPQAYKYKRTEDKRPNHERVLETACALIRKYHNDKSKKQDEKEIWTMALDTSISDPSYLFGRLLAIAEKAERDTYRGEGREPNAVRLQSVYAQRPLATWRILEEKLSSAYYPQLSPGSRAYYRKLISSIIDAMPTDPNELKKPLKDVYLLGYYHQRSALYQKKAEANSEERD